MKKILSALLVLAMLTSLIIVATVPAAAVNGDWSAYTLKTNDFVDDDSKNSEPGYEYTDDGLRVYAPTDSKWRPYATAQTTEMQSLQDGIYMQVRVDSFDYTTPGDRWFSFHVWDSPSVEPGKFGEVEDGMDYGLGIEMLMRFSGTDISRFQWSRDFTGRDMVEDKNFSDEEKKTVNVKDSANRALLTLEITYSVDDEIYIMKVNGMTAPDLINESLTSYFNENCDGSAYIGFTLQNSSTGDPAEFTVVKYGTSESDATVPAGTDSKAPTVYSSDIAEIDNAGVEEGMPAIVISGDADVSNHKRISSVAGSEVTITENGTIKVAARSASTSYLDFEYFVSNDISRDAKVFPYVAVITKNLCTCSWTDSDNNGTIDEYEKICTGNEQVRLYYRAGNIVTDTSTSTRKYQPDATKIGDSVYIGDDMYTLWLIDLHQCFTDEVDGNQVVDPEPQRIHGGRLDVYGLRNEAGRNSFEVCGLAYFALENDGSMYFADYLADLRGEEGDETTDEIGGETTETDTETVTETDNVTETENEETTTKEEVTTKEESTTNKEEQTTKKEEQTTKAPTGGDKNNNDKEEKKGCGSVAGVGAIAVVAVAAAGLISFKKKEED